MAIGIRKIEANGFSMPPLKEIIQVSTAMSTTMCRNTSMSVAVSAEAL